MQRLPTIASSTVFLRQVALQKKATKRRAPRGKSQKRSRIGSGSRMARLQTNLWPKWKQWLNKYYILRVPLVLFTEKLFLIEELNFWIGCGSTFGFPNDISRRLFNPGNLPPEFDIRWRHVGLLGVSVFFFVYYDSYSGGMKKQQAGCPRCAHHGTRDVTK